MRRKLFNYALILSFCMLNWSCSLFHAESMMKDEAGYYIRHYDSCGPIALHRAFKKLNIQLSKRDISREIQDTGNNTRVLLSLVHHQTISITLPSEIKAVVKKHGFEITTSKELKELDPKVDIALVLVAGSYLKGEAHWACFPVDSNITKYFGEATRIIKVYLLKETQ